jgi:ParB-like chromosome segregation protein Spo0J
VRSGAKRLGGDAIRRVTAPTRLAGNGRVLAAHLLGLDEVPCIVLAHLTPTQRRAYVLADNKLALNAGWDRLFLRAIKKGRAARSALIASTMHRS